jgi:4-amino-4-deoxy-L-arabinose transferase-like glycosyltransferase
MDHLRNFLKKHEWVLVAFFVVIFVIIRLPGTDLPLHQDEYKWPDITSPAYTGDIAIPHPPLSDLIYRTGGHIVGFNTNFRFIPLFFGALSLILLYYYVRLIYGCREASIASLIWIFSYYSILASLMVDTDGEILPFFFLIALIAYTKAVRTFGRASWKWYALLLVACIGGFLVKLSFVLVVAAIAADYIWEHRHKISRQLIGRIFGYGVGGVVLVAGLLLLANTIFPFFSLNQALSHGEHYFTLQRGWFQTAIQCIKALLYASPFLILLPFLSKKESIARARLFIFFLVFAFIFYIILFDFSVGALDRYLQLIILPLTVFTSAVVARAFKSEWRTKKFLPVLIVGIFVALIVVAVQYFPHFVPTLHPKSEWIVRILQFKWNFLYPFSGGSGPLGFYISFLFMALTWLITIAGIIYAIFKPHARAFIIIFLLPLGFAYSAAFGLEYMYGTWNGSAARLLAPAVEFMKNNPEVQKVTTYNDNGGHEIKEIGKYAMRLYIDPKFETDINARIAGLNEHKEHYFVLNVPRFRQDTIFQQFFDTCRIVYLERDKAVSAILYDCRYAPDLKSE